MSVGVTLSIDIAASRPKKSKNQRVLKHFVAKTLWNIVWVDVEPSLKVIWERLWPHSTSLLMKTHPHPNTTALQVDMRKWGRGKSSTTRKQEVEKAWVKRAVKGEQNSTANHRLLTSPGSMKPCYGTLILAESWRGRCQIDFNIQLGFLQSIFVLDLCQAAKCCPFTKKQWCL